MWSQPDMVNQTLYALGFATKAYEYFTDFFQIPDVVPKAGELMPINENLPMQYTEILSFFFQPLKLKIFRRKILILSLYLLKF